MRLGKESMKAAGIIVVVVLLTGSGRLTAEPILWDAARVKAAPEKFITVVPDGKGATTMEFRTGDRAWPSITLYPAGAKSWNFAPYRYLSLEIENLSPDVSASGNINAGDSGKYLLGSWSVRPGEKATFTYELNHRGTANFDPQFKAKWMPSEFAGQMNRDTSAVDCLKIYCGFAQYNRFRIADLRVYGRYTPNPATRSPTAFFPFIDEFGQYIHADWREKIHAKKDLPQRLAAEKTDPPPRSWDRYGGWANGPKLQATGFFRVERYRGKWYFVDPEGRLFFSRGVNSVTRGENWTLVGTRGKEAVYAEKTDPAGTPINFYRRNCELKYSTHDWAKFQPRRLSGWGFNTIGNWSETGVYRTRQMPYTLNLPLPRSTFLPDSNISDVYNPEFEQRLGRYLSVNLAWTVDDPFCIGYFIGNEVKFGDRTDLAKRVFQCDAGQPAKQALIRALRERYRDIADLNRAWKRDYSSWEQLAGVKTLPDDRSAAADFERFTREFIRRFYELSQKVIRQYAPHHLYLGSRIPCFDMYRPWVNEPHARYADVFSMNNYALQFDNLGLAGVPADKPILISESTVGHRDRGLFGSLAYPGCAPGARESALDRMLESAARHPQIVGIHHFEFKDQPLNGRYDGENYGIGLIDRTDTPYDDFVGANRRFSERLYEYRLNTQPVRLPLTVNR